MKKPVIIAILILLVPSLSHAAWWDPSTWFQTEPSESVAGAVDSVTTPSPEPIVVEKEVIKEVPVEKIVEKIVEKPIVKETIVEKIVKVADDSVVTENQELKKKIVLLELTVDGLKAEIKRRELEVSKWQNERDVMARNYSELLSGRANQESSRRAEISRGLAQIEYDLVKNQVESQRCEKVDCDTRALRDSYNKLILRRAELLAELAGL